jgi:hypothetical protein
MIGRFEVKIVRMKSGEDIISFCFEDKETKTIYLKHPKTFYYNFDIETGEEDLMLVDWLPKQAYYSQDIAFSSDNILFITFTTVEFGSTYLESILEFLEPQSELATNIKSTLDTKTESEIIKQTLH